MAKDLEILCFGCGFDGGGGDIFPFNPFLYLYLVYILSFNFCVCGGCANLGLRVGPSRKVKFSNYDSCNKPYVFFFIMFFYFSTYNPPEIHSTY